MAEDGRLGFIISLTDESVTKVAKQIKEQFRQIGLSAEKAGSDIDREFSRVPSSLSETAKQADAVQVAFTKIGGTLSSLVGVGSAMGFVKQVFSVRAEMQNTEAMLRVFLGSAEKANDFFKSLQGYAYNNVFEFKDLAKQSAQLLAYKTNVEEVIPTLNKLSEIAAGTNMPLEHLVAIFNKVKANNKLDGQAVMSLGNMGIDIYEQLAQIKNAEESIKPVNEQVQYTRDSVKGLSLTFEDLQKVINNVSTDGGMFAGMMEEKMKTLGDSWGLMQDNLTNMFNEIGEQMQGFLRGAMGVGNAIIENYDKIAKAIAIVIAAYGTAKAANIAMNAVHESTLHTTKMSNATWSLRAELLIANAQAGVKVSKVEQDIIDKQRAEIAELERSITATQKKTIIEQAQRDNLADILTDTQKQQLAQRGLNQESEAYIPIATSLLTREQKIAFAQADLTNNAADYIDALRKQKRANQELVSGYEDLAKKTQRRLEAAKEERQTGEEIVSYLSMETSQLEEVAKAAKENGDEKAYLAVTSKLTAKQLELEEARTMTDAAAKKVAAAEAERLAQQEARESLAHGKNTVAEGVETGATKALTGAKKMLALVVDKVRNSISALWATIKANPIGLVIAAITGAVAIFKKFTASAREQREATKSVERSAGEAAAKVDDLFDALRNCKEGTDLYTSSLKKLKSEYPELIQHFLDEKGNLNDIESAYEAVKKAAMNAARAEAKRQLIVQKSGETEESIAGDTQDLFKRLSKDLTTRQRAEINKVVEKLRNGDYGDNATSKAGAEIARITGKNNMLVYKNLREIYNAQRELDAFVTNLNVAGDAIEEAKGKGVVDDAVKPKGKKYYEDLITDAQGRIDALTEDQFKDGTGQRIKAEAEKEIEAAKRALKKWATGKDKNKEALRSSLQQNDMTLLAQRNSARDAALSYEQAIIDGLDEGFDKELRQIKLNAEQRKNALSDAIASDEHTIRDEAERLWKVRHPDATTSFDRRKVRFDSSKGTSKDQFSGLGLSDSDVEYLYNLATSKHEEYLQKEKQFNQEQSNSVQQLYKEILDNASDVEKQLSKIDEKYRTGRAALEQAMLNDEAVTAERRTAILTAQDKLYERERRAIEDSALGNYKTFQQKREALARQYAEKRRDLVAAGGNQENEELLERDYMLEYSALLLSEDAEYKQFLTRVDGMITAELQKLLKEAKKTLDDAIAKGLAKDSEEVMKLRAQIAELEQQIEDANETQEAIRIDKWAKWGAQVSQLGNEIETLGSSIDGVAGEVISGIGSMMGTVGSGVAAAAQLAKGGLTSLEKASVIISIISAAVQVVQKIRSLVQASEERKAKAELDAYKERVAKLTDAYEALEAAANKAYGSAKKALLNKRLVEQNKLLKEQEARRDALLKKQQELENTKWTARDWFKSYKLSDDEKAELDALNDSIKQSAESLAELRQAAKDAIFGEDIQTAISNFASALQEAWQEGTSFDAEAFAVDQIKKMLNEEMLQMMKMLDDVYSMAGTKIGDTFIRQFEDRNGEFVSMQYIRDKIEEFLANDGRIDDDEKAEIARLYKRLQELTEEAYGWSKDIYEEDASRSGSSKGVAQASQDSIDELNGRMTAVQGHTYNISANTDILRENTAAMMRSVLQIEEYTRHLVAMDRNIQDMRTYGVKAL
ncbi:MAG: hypothetical protein IJV22_06140 [Bacteroidales bacterium]|nr:hypothetical protein [Bacteroidales bacterium]